MNNLLQLLSNNILYRVGLSNKNDEIISVIEKYFYLRKKIYLHRNIYSLIKLDKLLSKDNKMKEKERKKYKFLVKDMKLKKRKYKSVDSELLFKNIEITELRATVYLFENLKLTHTDNIVTETSIKHKIELSNNNNKWTILKDDYLDTLSKQLNKISYNTDLLLTLNKNNINKLKIEDNSSKTISLKKNNISSLSLKTYNRNAAFNYTEKYWYYTDKDKTKYNPYYINFEEYPGNWDCTNFTSQVLRAGGISDDRNGSTHWYYTGNNDTNWSNDKWTSSWTGVVAFYNYIIKNTDAGGPNVTIHKNFSNYTIKNADIIQFRFPGDNTWDHSVVITGTYKNRYGVKLPLITYHSGPIHNKKFEDMNYEEYRIIEINGYK